MRAVFPLLCIALVACDGNQSAHPPNGSISGALQRGMSEQQVTQVSSNRVPDRIVMTTCGTETPQPFPCKVFVYDGGLRTGQFDRKLSVVFEDVRGHWVVSQWL
jgi:hypothetical protein